MPRTHAERLYDRHRSAILTGSAALSLTTAVAMNATLPLAYGHLPSTYGFGAAVVVTLGAYLTGSRRIGEVAAVTAASQLAASAATPSLRGWLQRRT